MSAKEPTILFSLDLEDHTGRYDAGARYVENAKSYLDYLESIAIRGTFFTVGLVARHAPQLLREIAARGHEIACHSLNHTPLPKQTPQAFRDATATARHLLQDVTGQSVEGYRAPIFSLTRQADWAPGILSELGFAYSSSVLPSTNPLFGFDGQPEVPFTWPSGLIEFPVVLGSVLGKRVPFLGGFYLRYLPQSVIRRSMARLPVGAQAWTYIHPYDIDHAEKDWRMAETATWVSLLLWFNRRGTIDKLDRLRDHFADRTFGEAAAAMTQGGLH